MPMKKRVELLRWAGQQEGRYLIEDDHDSEYRYKGKPIPSLQSIDAGENVIYLGTFSNSIAPSLRVSYMVLPKPLLKVYQEKCCFYSTTVPKLSQKVLERFLEEGHFGRHLNRMRSVYRSKHDFLMAELKKYNWVKHIYGENAGLHLLVEVDSAYSEAQLLEALAEHGVKAEGLSHYDIEAEGLFHCDIEEKGLSHCDMEAEGRGLLQENSRKNPVLLLGYGNLGEEEIKRGLERIGEVLEKEKSLR